MDISFTGNMNGTDNSLYIEKTYIREENGQSYVYKVGEDGLLTKQIIQTGGSLYGYYTEVKSGLTLEDYVAFPYGKTVKEAGPAVPVEITGLAEVPQAGDEFNDIF